MSRLAVWSALLGLLVALGLALLTAPEAGALCTENNDEDPRCTCGDQDLPAWAEGRDGDGKLRVRRYRDHAEVTAFPRDRETSCLGWPIVGTERWGPNLGFGTRRAGRKHATAWVMPDTPDRPQCDAAAQGKPTIVYRMLIDGYDGKPQGLNYCTRSAPEPGFTPADCNPGDGDLVKGPWGGCFHDVLFKSVDFRNEIRAGSNHDDVVQAAQAAVHGWIVVQGSIWANTDSHITQFKAFRQFNADTRGMVFHDVVMTHEPDFLRDCATRIAEGTNPGKGCGVISKIKPGELDMPLWLVGFRTPGTNILFEHGNIGGRWTKVIAIDTRPEDYRLGKGVPAPTVYASLEEAVAAGEELFPYAHLQCAGWADPPAGCVESRGPTERIRPGPSPPAPSS